MKLGDIARVQGGYAFKSSEFQDTGTPIIRIGNLDGDFVNIDNKICYPEEFSIKHPEFLIDKGDVLVAMSGATVGKIGVFIDDTKALLNQRVGKIIPLGGIDKRVLYYYCKSPSFMNLIQKEAFGCAQPNISSRSLEGFEINIPNIDKHYEMINVLDRVSKIIENKKQQLTEYDHLIKSRFVEMFGDQNNNPFKWNVKTIGETCKLKSGNSLPLSFENEGGPIPYIKVGDMNLSGNEKYITNSSRYVTVKTAGKGVFDIGTIIFPKRGGAIGTNKKRMTISPICADLNVMGVTPLEKLNSHYLLAFFDEIDMGSLNNGSSVPQINNIDIAPLKICLPPMELQNQFGDFVQQVDKLKFDVQKSLDETRELFDSLMQKYFG